MTAAAIPADIQPVEPSYRHALRARAVLFWGPLLVATLVADWMLLSETALAGLLPAWRAARLKPVEALRTE